MKIRYPIAALCLFALGVIAGRRDERVESLSIYVADSLLQLTILAERDTIETLRRQLDGCRRDVLLLLDR